MVNEDGSTMLNALALARQQGVHGLLEAAPTSVLPGPLRANYILRVVVAKSGGEHQEDVAASNVRRDRLDGQEHIHLKVLGRGARGELRNAEEIIPDISAFQLINVQNRLQPAEAPSRARSDNHALRFVRQTLGFRLTMGVLGVFGGCF